MQPRPESRIESLEQRASIIEAKLLELSSDTAEELKAIRVDQKASFKQIGDTFVKIEEAMATKEALKQLRDEMKADMTAMESRIDGKMVAMEARIVEQVNTSVADLKTGLLEALRDLKKDS